MTPNQQTVFTPELRQRLFAVVMDAFGQWEELEQMLLLQMGERLESYSSRKDGMKTVVFGLLFNVMESQGRLPEFVKAACRHAPANRELYGTATELGWAPEAPDTTDEAAASVRTGLRALTELLREPEVNAELRTFRAALEGADRRIHLVGDYKGLHDRLHELQFRCYNTILSARREFPQGKTKEQLGQDSRELKRLTRQMRVITQRPTLDPADFPWIEENLEPARVGLDEAIAESSSSKLDDVISMLTEVMQIQPSVVNSLLLRSVRDLDLPTLQVMLRQVDAKLIALGADERQRMLFSRGVSNLNLLDTELQAQMKSHRAWQMVENNFRLLQAALDKPLDDVKNSWQTLQLKLTVVTNGVTDDWIEALTEVRGLLDDAISAGARSQIADFFSELHTLASDRFYIVDKEMKDLCEKLRPLGNELDAALQVME